MNISLSFVRRFGTLFGFIAVVTFFWLNVPDTFLTVRNWLNISQQISMLAVVAFTMTIVMVMNDFDLSVGAMASLSGIVAAVLFSQGQPVAVGVSLPLPGRACHCTRSLDGQVEHRQLTAADSAFGP